MPRTKAQAESRPSIKLIAKGQPFEIIVCHGTKISAASLLTLQRICYLIAERS